MKENGHPNIEYEKLYTDLHILHYIEIYNIKKSIYNIFSKNPYLNLINVFKILNNLDISSEVDTTFLNLIKIFGKEDENNHYYYSGEPYENSYGSSDVNDYFGYYYHHNGLPFPEKNDFPSEVYEEPSFKWVDEITYWDTDEPTIEDEITYWDTDEPMIEDEITYKDTDEPTMQTGNTKKTDFPIDSIKDYNIWLDMYFDRFINDSKSYFIIDSRDMINFNEFNSKDFKDFFKDYDFDKPVKNKSSFNGEDNEFKTKNATLIVEINK